MTEEHRDSLLTAYSNNIDLSDQEVLGELEILKTISGNQIIIEGGSDADTVREYAALIKACDLFKDKLDQSQVALPEYDAAIDEIEKYFDSGSIISNKSLTVALKALKQLRELKIKIDLHHSTYPR